MNLRVGIFVVVCTAACGGDGNVRPDGGIDANTEPLQIAQVVPEDLAVNVAVDATVTVTFDRDLDAATVTGTSFSVSSGGRELVGTLAVSGNSVVFKSSTIPPEKTYILDVTTDVKDTAGVALGAAFSSQFTTVTRSWTAEVEIDTGDTVAQPAWVRVTADGHAIAAWFQPAPGHANVSTQRRWLRNYVWDATAQQLSTEAGEALSVDLGGTDSELGALIWAEEDASYQTIYANVAGSTKYVYHGIYGATDPQIEGDENGNVIALWVQGNDQGNHDLMAARLTSGEFTGHAAIETSDAVPQQVRLAMHRPSGSAVAVWIADDDVWTNTYTVAGGWGSARTVENLNAISTLPEIVIDANGRAFVAWISISTIDGIATVYANSTVAGIGTDWGSPQQLEFDVANATDVQIGADDAGNAIAIWRQQKDGKFRVWSARYMPGMGWLPRVPVETLTGDAGPPKLAVHPDTGDAVAMFAIDTGTTTEVYYNVFDSWTDNGKGAWLGAMTLATNAMHPSVAIDRNHVAIATCLQHDGTRYNTVSRMLRP